MEHSEYSTTTTPFNHERPQYCPLNKNVTAATIQSLDTVRALHQTVVTLRTALEDAHKEIDDLKKEISINNDIEKGKIYHLENNNNSDADIVKTDTDHTVQCQRKQSSSTSIKRLAPDNDLIDKQQKTKSNSKLNEIPIFPLEKENVNKSTGGDQKTKVDNTNKLIEINAKFSKQFSNKIPKKKKSKYLLLNKKSEQSEIKSFTIRPTINDNNNSNNTGNSTINKQMTSKIIDVKIKLSSNVKNLNSSTDETADADDAEDDDKETNTHQQQLNETEKSLNLSDNKMEDVNNQNLPNENNNNNNNNINNYEHKQSTMEFHCPDEVVDNIELIFSSDDKELPQEMDLVSISDYEPWQKAGQSGTPILVNFGDLSSSITSFDNHEQNPNNKSNENLNCVLVNNRNEQMKIGNNNRDSLIYNDDDDDDVFYQQSFDIHNEQSVQRIKSNNENDDEGTIDKLYLKTSDSLQNNNGRKWTNYSIDINTDISNCGINEHEPNHHHHQQQQPYNRKLQHFTNMEYRPIIHRQALGNRMTTIGQNQNQNQFHPSITSIDNDDKNTNLTCDKYFRNQPLAFVKDNCRPIIESCGDDGGSGGDDVSNNTTTTKHIISNNNKRSSFAQTDITALPEYWRSESHITNKNETTTSFHNGNNNNNNTNVFTLPSKFITPSEQQRGTSITTTPTTTTNDQCTINNRLKSLRIADKTKEARRTLLSDINFTSMVPELSRSADHLCRGGGGDGSNNNNPHQKQISAHSYYKGNTLKTPDYMNSKGLIPSLTSPGVSQWTVYDNSLGTQTESQTSYWSQQRGDSFDSNKSFSMGLRYGDGLNKHQRSRSVPSVVRCSICKRSHHTNRNRTLLRTSESMQNYPPLRVTFQEPHDSNQKLHEHHQQQQQNNPRGSLPDLRYECTCNNRINESTTSIESSKHQQYHHQNYHPHPHPHHHHHHHQHQHHQHPVTLSKGSTTMGYSRNIKLPRNYGDSSESTESLLDEADAFIARTMTSTNTEYSLNQLTTNDNNGGGGGGGGGGGCEKSLKNRRCSENDINKKDYQKSKLSLPFLPKSPKCLKPGHLAKVIAKNGRIVIGRVRYIGPLVRLLDRKTIANNLDDARNINHGDDDADGDDENDQYYVGIQLNTKHGDCDGTIDGRKFFDCQPQYGLFVPFKKIVMAWTG